MQTQSSGAGPRIVRGALWGLLSVLLLAGGWVFLQACGTHSILGFSRNYCPAPVDHSVLQKEAAVGEDLRRQVHQAELRVAEAPICPPRRQQMTQQQKTELQRLPIERGAKTGKLQITLAWDTYDDLDLNLYCPGGTISSYPHQSGPGICGDGTKDLDANSKAGPQSTTNPIENIVFKDNIPPGLYTIEVIEYQARQGEIPNEIHYRLKIKWNDQEKFCTGVVTWTSSNSTERDAEGLIGGYYQTLSWTYGDALPDCNFQVKTGYRKNINK